MKSLLGERRHALGTLLVAAAVVVFVGSVLPLPTTGGDVALAGPLGVGADKWVHAASYAVIAGLAVLDGRPRRAAFGVVGLVAVVLAVAAVAAGVEAVQSLVPGRTASGGDIVANTVGAVVGAVTGTWVTARRRRIGPFE